MARPQRKGCDAGHVRHCVECEMADLEASIGARSIARLRQWDIFGIFLIISNKAAKPPGTANCGGCLKHASNGTAILTK